MAARELENLIAEAVARFARDDGAGAWQPPALDEPAALARLIDHTLLKPEAGEEQIRVLCAEAREYGFGAICVNATWVPLCIEELAGTTVKTAATIGFPLGATLPAVKAYEVEQAARLGATEVDMVLSVGRLRDGDFRAVYRDIAAVADAARDNGVLLKVIFETGFLDEEQKIAACVICQEAGADFVKTATGFFGGGATVEDIALMRQVVGSRLGVKAAGGVRTAEDALRMVAAGANRIGTSGGVRIIQEFAGLQTQPAGAPAGDSY
jgi:deoxyribose-phosphate aldolase